MANYRTMVEEAGIGRTPQICQDALIEELQTLFKGKKYVGQQGREELRFYKQDLPVPEDNDVDADYAGAPAPYICVTMDSGEIKEEDMAQSVSFSLVICCYDDGLKREGYQDVANIKEDIIQRLCSRPYFGGAFTVLKPISWALQIQDTRPYYYGAVSFDATAPAMTQDTELEELL